MSFTLGQFEIRLLPPRFDSRPIVQLNGFGIDESNVAQAIEAFEELMSILEGEGAMVVKHYNVNVDPDLIPQ